MYDFEKLGAFYLGRKVEPGTNDVSDELVLYDSRDLTTHAVIIGMTGSGKTGLGIGLFFPAEERFRLAMRLNNLLAAPGFEAWMHGVPLDPARFFYTDSGKPRVSILSIAHLADAERMFFVCMLLNELIAWMRTQQGTSSLRAILYMDELFGYMPPVAEPPSKRLFLTLLKQARAYGLGVVLATQNPVDLDYKGLSNTGTWFIGRLQTERDKARVMEGLEGASQGGRFDRPFMEQTLAGLGERRFLLHNVHEDRPVIFNTRWAMSYLAGPLTRDQIRSLMSGTEPEAAAPPASGAATPSALRVDVAAPLLPPSIRQFYLHADGDAPVYFPRLVAAAEIAFFNSRHSLDERRRVLCVSEFADDGRAPAWGHAEKLPVDTDALEDQAPQGAKYAECPPAAADAANYTRWEKDFGRWLRQNETIRLYQSARFRMTSAAGESEGEFRTRLQHKASEERDAAIAGIRKRYATKATTLENRLLRAEQAVARQAGQSNRKALDTAVSFGTAILGAVLGRKRISASRIGSAIRSAGGARNEAADVARARDTVEKVRADIEALNASLQAEIDALDTTYDGQAETLTEVLIKARVADVQVLLCGLLWMPYRDAGGGRFEVAWQP